MTIRTDLILDQGATFRVAIDLFDNNNDPIDTTNLEAAAYMRKHYTSSSFVEFDTEFVEETHELILSMDAIRTSNVVPGRYVYDVILMFEDGSIDRILEGIITVTPGVTKQSE